MAAKFWHLTKFVLIFLNFFRMVLKHSADLDGITELIENHIPKAKRARLFGRELNFILPRDEVQM